MKQTMLLALCCLPLLTHAAVYRCDINGVATYSQTPCADNAQKIEVKAASGIKSQGSGDYQAEFAQLGNEQQVRNNQHRIEQLNKTLAKLEQQREAELKQRVRDNQHELNNGTEDHFKQTLQRETDAINARYSSQIGAIKDEIKQLQTQNKALSTN